MDRQRETLPPYSRGSVGSLTLQRAAEGISTRPAPRQGGATRIAADVSAQNHDRFGRTDSGFTLIEALLSMLVLSLVVFIVPHLFGGGLQQVRWQRERLQLENLARDKMEEIVAMLYSDIAWGSASESPWFKNTTLSDTVTIDGQSYGRDVVVVPYLDNAGNVIVINNQGEATAVEAQISAGTIAAEIKKIVVYLGDLTLQTVLVDSAGSASMKG